jgi:molybdate transport system regulatory protein
MTLTWVICGSGRGVGKTHLAERLCEVLPSAVYAKQGCGQAKAGKTPNFFATEEELAAFVEEARARHEHVVVESNAWARNGRGDVIIFLDGIPGQGESRPDAKELRAKSHLRVIPGSSIRECKKVLRRRLGDASLREAVCDLLVQHKHFLGGLEPSVNTKVWFTVDGMHAFGSGLAKLLESVDRCGTLQEAARAVGMSYRRAWGLIKKAEKHMGATLIVPRTGGAGGGGTTLSREGKQLLETFQRLNREVAAFANERFALRFEKEVP